MSTKFNKRQLPDSTVYNDEETTFQAKVLLPIATPTDDKEAITFKFYKDEREEIDTALNAKANISGQVFTGAVSATNLSGTNTGDNAPNSLYSGLVTNATHTGEVTGSTALTITNGAVTNAKLANVATSTLKGRVTAATGVVEDLTASQVRTLLNVADGANNYVHPANHLASIITQDASNRFVTDTEKSAWNAKEPAIASGTISQYWRGDKTWQEFPTIQTIDNIPTDGSNNAVSSNGVFDALATKAPISSVHNPVTLGTANGLSLATQQLSLGLASSGTAGALSGTDWNTFNAKFNTPTGLTTNYLPKWNGGAFVNSSIFDNGTNIGIGTTNPTANLTVKGAYSVGSSIPANWALLSAGRMGVANNNKGLYFDIFNDYAEVSTYDWSLGQTYPMVFQGNGGNSMFGTNVDNLVDRVQVAGTISASPATTANQVPTWGQVQAIVKPYKVYTALLTQTGTNAPTATVLENTLGFTISWARIGVGAYVGTFSTSIDINKAVRFISNGITGAAGNYSKIGINSTDVRIYNYILPTLTDLNSEVNIEIRIYN